MYYDHLKLNRCHDRLVNTESPNATLPHLLQVIGIRQEEPESGDPASQAAALALSGLERASSFPPFGNCRMMRRARQVAVGEGDDAPDQPFVNTAVVAASLLQTSHAPDTSYQVVLEILKQCHESQDCMLVARLSGIRACLFCGMRVEYDPETSPSSGDASQLARNSHFAVALVCTTEVAVRVHCDWLPRVYCRVCFSFQVGQKRPSRQEKACHRSLMPFQGCFSACCTSCASGFFVARSAD